MPQLIDRLTAIVDRILDFAEDVLQGEPLRAIGYGAGVAIYFIARASGNIEDVPLDQALLQGAALAATLVGVIETARRFVFSPRSVQAIKLGIKL